MATLRERIIKRLGGVTETVHQTARARAYEAGFEDGGEDEPSSGIVKKFGYRSALSGTGRDLGGLEHDQVMDVAWKVYLSSPVAKRYLQVKRDYELGRGVEPKANDAELQVILDEFWQLNKLRARLKRFALQLHLLGEQMFPVFVRETDGRAKLGYIDPSEIAQVVTHPDNVLEKWAVVLKEQMISTEQQWLTAKSGKRVYRIVREDEGATDGETVTISSYEGKLVTHQQATIQDWEEDMLKAFSLDDYTGTCFYFSRNDLSNQARGHTDLLQVADWLDQDDQTLFGLADREQMGGYFIADVTLTGTNEDGVAARAKQLKANPPKPGSVNVHNDTETWNLAAPDLKQQPSIETHNALLTYNLGGLGLPSHWYGRGDETNRATAQAQGDPTWKTMEHDQDQIRDMILMLLEFARDQAEIAGRWRPATDDADDITVQMPEMTNKDLVSLSSAATAFATALMTAVDQGWMSREKAIEAWAKLMSEFDIEIDTEAELEAVDGEQEQGELATHKSASDWLTLHGVLVAGEEPVAAPAEIPQAG